MYSTNQKKQRPAPFSFHCVICFEAFHLVDRPPVVLPCGHTYLCEPCSKRLKRCMECRTSLFLPKQQLFVPNSAGSSLLPPPSPVNARQIRSTGSHLSRYNNNRNHNQHHQASPQNGLVGAGIAAVEIPLHLPKTQVMIALMELSSFTSKCCRIEVLQNRRDAIASLVFQT